MNFAHAVQQKPRRGERNEALDSQVQPEGLHRPERERAAAPRAGPKDGGALGGGDAEARRVHEPKLQGGAGRKLDEALEQGAADSRRQGDQADIAARGRALGEGGGAIGKDAGAELELGRAVPREAGDAEADGGARQGAHVDAGPGHEP